MPFSPVPSPPWLAMQAELLALRADKERLEAEAEELRAQVGTGRCCSWVRARAQLCVRGQGLDAAVECW